MKPLYLIALALIALVPIAAHAQAASDLRERPFWMSVGLGRSTDGLSASGMASYQTGGYTLFAVRTAYSGELPIDFSITPKERVWGTGVLYGGVLRRSDWLVSISTGLAFVNRVERGDLLDDGCDLMEKLCLFGKSTFEEIRSHAIGLPLDAQVFLTPRSSFLGVGLHGYATFSPVGTAGGVALHLHLGQPK